MAQIHVGKMIPFNLIPVDALGNVRPLEGAAVVAVEAPAEIINLAPNGLSGFVGNRTGEGVSVKFTADGDGKIDGAPDFNVHYEAQIDLLGLDAIAFKTNVFGDEVDLPTA